MIRFGRVAAHPATLIVVWAVTRIATILLVRTPTYLQHLVGDVTYYLRQLDRWDQGGVQAVLVEYPTPVAYGFKALEIITGPTSTGFVAGFVGAMLLLDAGFSIALWLGGRDALGTAAAWFWIVFLPLIGPLAYFRFDLLPAVLAGLALLWAARRPAVAGALIGLGAATKLWPALLILPLLGSRQVRARTITGFVGCGFGLALVSLIAGGWERLVSPLTWQSARDLQIEAVTAVPPMLAWGFGSPEYAVGYSQHNAFEIAGPWVDRLQILSDGLVLAGLIVIAWLCVRLVRCGTSRAGTAHTGSTAGGTLPPGATAVVMLAIIAVVIVANKTLSPQYVIWLGGPLAALLAAPPGPPPDPPLDPPPVAAGTPAPPDPGALRGAEIRLLATTTLMLAVLTHMVFPLAYPHLTDHTQLSAAAAVVLAIRNAGLVAYAIWVCWLGIRLTRRGMRSLPTAVAE